MTKNTAPNRAPTLRYPHCNRSDLNRAIIKFAKQQARESTHHIILAPHTPMTMHQSKRLLRKWDGLLNRQILGGRWNNKEHLHCKWIAFPEHVHSEPHWHLLWRMSGDLAKAKANKVLSGKFSNGLKYGGRINGKLTHGLDWIVHRHWKRTICSGTSKVVRIFDPEGLGYYVTKEQWNSVAYDNIVMSGEFKTSLPKAA